MSFVVCCVPDCFVRSVEGGILHSFPNPETERERFDVWIAKVGGEVATIDHNYVYRNKRVCHKHFEQIYYGSKNRLMKTAIPKLHLPGMTSDLPITQQLPTQKLKRKLKDCTEPTTVGPSRSSGSKRSMVSADQLNSLLDFMKEHLILAQGMSRGRHGKLVTLKTWNACAKRLNAMKPGAVKDGKGWSKYWCDWKYRVRRHVLEIKAAKKNNRFSIDRPAPLSAVEETIVSIIGEDTFESVVIKNDPLSDDVNDNLPDGNNHINNVSETHCYSAKPKRRKKSNSLKEALDMEVNSLNSSLDIKTSIVGNEESGARPKRRKKSNSLKEALDMEENSLNSSLDIKTSIVGNEESEHGDEASQFLKIEQQKLEVSKKIQDSAQDIATQLTRLTDVMVQIRDVLINKFND